MDSEAATIDDCGRLLSGTGSSNWCHPAADRSVQATLVQLLRPQLLNEIVGLVCRVVIPPGEARRQPFLSRL